MGDWKEKIDTAITAGSIAANVLNPAAYGPTEQYSDYYSQQVQSSISQTDTGRENDSTSSR